MTSTLPLGHEPFGRELRVERLEAEWRFRVILEIKALMSMEMSFFDSVLPWFRAVGVSKRRTQAGTLVLRLMGRPATSSAESCAGLKRPCTGSCLEGRAKKDISMLFCIVSFLGVLIVKPCSRSPFNMQ